jgi:hypothetical protein
MHENGHMIIDRTHIDVLIRGERVRRAHSTLNQNACVLWGHIARIFCLVTNTLASYQGLFDLSEMDSRHNSDLCAGLCRDACVLD